MHMGALPAHVDGKHHSLLKYVTKLLDNHESICTTGHAWSVQCSQALCTAIAAVSIVAVFFTPPVGSVFKQQSTVRSMNVLVAFFFTVDAVLKFLAYGVLVTPTAYLQVSACSECLQTRAQAGTPDTCNKTAQTWTLWLSPVCS